MPRRFTSLRIWLFVTMLVCAGLGLGIGTAVYKGLESSREESEDRAAALVKARAIAGLLDRGARQGELLAAQAVLENDQLEVRRGAERMYLGPVPASHEPELEVRVPWAEGSVVVRDYHSVSTGAGADFTVVLAVVLAVVIAAVMTAASLLTRPITGPIARAIAAAERIARGDLSARAGVSGPQELASLGAAIDGMASRLQAGEEERRRFLADISHEIATPVGTLLGFSQALADGTASSESDRAEASAVIARESQRLRGLLADLRELTSLDIVANVKRSRLRLADVAQELGARFHSSAEDAGVALTVTSDQSTVITDARLLDMVAANLVSNAIRYTPAGGKVTAELRRRGDDLRLTVADTGIGISPEHQARIFERLYRVDDARDRASGGSGLGLAIAARAAQNLGGRLEVRSAPGKGSTFTLTAPAGGPHGARDDTAGVRAAAPSS